MPIYFQDFFQNSWLLLGYLVALIIFVPFNLISLAVNLFIIYYFRSISISKARQLRRIESNTRSPVFTLLNESLRGLVSIRSFKKEKFFFK